MLTKPIRPLSQSRLTLALAFLLVALWPQAAAAQGWGASAKRVADSFFNTPQGRKTLTDTVDPKKLASGFKYTCLDNGDSITATFMWDIKGGWKTYNAKVVWRCTQKAHVSAVLTGNWTMGLKADKARVEQYFARLWTTLPGTGTWLTNAAAHMNQVLSNPLFKQQVAQALVTLTHPSASATGITVSGSSKQAVLLTLSWKRKGVAHTSKIAWTCSAKGHGGASITKESVWVGKVNAAGQKSVNVYFKTWMWGALSARLKGTRAESGTWNLVCTKNPQGLGPKSQTIYSLSQVGARLVGNPIGASSVNGFVSFQIGQHAFFGYFTGSKGIVGKWVDGLDKSTGGFSLAKQ